MEDRILNEKESVELITRMIRNTQNKVELGEGNVFLLWGYLCAGFSLLIYVLLLMGTNYWCYWLWFLLPAIGYPVMIKNKWNSRPSVTTYIDKIISYLWIVIGGLALLIPFANLLASYTLPILFIICLLINIGVTLTGLFISFRPVTAGGILGLILAFAFLLPLGVHQNLLFAVMAILTLIIPGHILNRSIEKKLNAETNV